MLKFNTLYDVYIVQRHYTVLLKGNRTFCLILGIGIFLENSFSTVFHEVEDHLASVLSTP